METLIVIILFLILIVVPIMGFFEWISKLATEQPLLFFVILVVFFLFLYALRRFQQSRKEQKIADYVSRLSVLRMDNMSGIEFEQAIAKMIERLGYTNINMTPRSGDHGVDILAYKDGYKYAIQCKCYSSSVGNKAIQEVFSGQYYYKAQKAVVVTNSKFTKNAIDEAKRLDVELWDRVTLNRLLNTANISDTQADSSDNRKSFIAKDNKGFGTWGGIAVASFVILGFLIFGSLDRNDNTENKNEDSILSTGNVIKTEENVDENKPTQQADLKQNSVDNEKVVDKPDVNTETETKNLVANIQKDKKTAKEFLADFKDSYDKREDVYGQYAGANKDTMTPEEWNAYLEACVEAEDDFYEEYKDAVFENLNIQYLCNQYINGLSEQYNAIKEWKADSNSEEGDSLWLSGYYDRACVIVELSEYYDVDIPETTVTSLKKEIDAKDSSNEPVTGNSTVDKEMVKQAQELLNTIGFFCGNADGVAGRRTIKSIKRFQEMYDYNPIDGIIDDELISQLEKVASQKASGEERETDA